MSTETGTPIAHGQHDLLQALRWRYATKVFDKNKKIPPHEWTLLQQALVLTPSSYGLQPWKFFVVQNEAIRTQLCEEAFNKQQQVLECSHFVVLAVKRGLNEQDVDRLIGRMSEIRGIPVPNLGIYRDFMAEGIRVANKYRYIDTWMSRQVYIALGQLLLNAALLRIDACPMEGVGAVCSRILGPMAEGYSAVCACALGYRSPTDKYASVPKVRFDLNDVFVNV